MKIQKDHQKEIIVLLILSVIAGGWVFWSSVIPQDPEIHILNVGEGNSVFIETAHHQTILIDGGPSAAILSLLGSLLGPFRNRIDLLVLTDPVPGNFGGLSAIISRYPVGMIVDEHWRILDSNYQRFLDALSAQEPGTVIGPLVQGQTLTIDGGTIRALWPTRDALALPSSKPGPEASGGIQDQSLVLDIQLAGRYVLLPSGISTSIEKILLADHQFSPADILVVADHGSRFSTSPEFVRGTHPSIAIISSGKKTVVDHPAQSVVARLQDAGAKVYQTARDGTIGITLRSSGIDVRTHQR